DTGRIKVIHPGRRRQTDPGLGEVGLDMSMARGGFGQGNVAHPAEVLKRDAALCRERVIASHQQQELTRRAGRGSDPGSLSVIVTKTSPSVKPSTVTTATSP